MKYYIMTVVLLFTAFVLFAQDKNVDSNQPAGTFSLGTRNTASMFNDDEAVGLGIGGQFRIQFSNRINSEWFLDYITSKNGNYTTRNDYHIGWSIMYYPGKHIHFNKLFQPYLLAGHCFDLSKVKEQKNPANAADRLSMATQAGIGTHINITNRFDCSLSAQYMLHFGKDIETTINNNVVTIEKKKSSSPDGHLLLSLSFNYKLFRLWKNKKSSI